MRIPQRLLLIAQLAIAAASTSELPGQVPPGHCVVTLSPPGLQKPGIAFLDPLNGKTILVSDPQTLLAGTVHGVVAATLGGDLVVAVQNSATGNDLLARVKLAGNQVSAVGLFANGFQGAITALAPLRGNGFAVGTTTAILRVPQAGGTPTPVFSGPWCRDLCLTGTDAAALVTDLSGASAAIVTFPLGGGAATSRPLSLPRPRAIGWADSVGGYLVGTEGGDLFTVDASSLVGTLLVSPLRGPILSITFATNHGIHVFGTPGALQTLENATVGRALPLPTTSQPVELDWVPFASTFAIESSPCPGSTGPPSIGSLGGAPFPGNSRFSVTLSGALPSSSAFLLLGIDKTSLDLGPFGAPGCRVLTTPLVTVTVATGTLGKAVLGLAIPPDASLAGGAVSLQWLVLDPVNVLGLVTSARGRAEL